MDVGHAIEVLGQSSLIDIVTSEMDDGDFLVVPVGGLSLRQGETRGQPNEERD